jgi:hypothetical protein
MFHIYLLRYAIVEEINSDQMQYYSQSIDFCSDLVDKLIQVDLRRSLCIGRKDGTVPERHLGGSHKNHIQSQGIRENQSIP